MATVCPYAIAGFDNPPQLCEVCERMPWRTFIAHIYMKRDARHLEYKASMAAFLIDLSQGQEIGRDVDALGLFKRAVYLAVSSSYRATILLGCKVKSSSIASP